MPDLIVSLFWLLLFVGGGVFLAYQRIDLKTSTVAVAERRVRKQRDARGHR